MELEKNNNEYIINILAKDPTSDKMKLRFYLTNPNVPGWTKPDKNWTTIFNRTISNIDAVSILDSKAIIVLISRLEFEQKEFINELIDKINKTDMEVKSDSKKEEMFIRVLPKSEPRPGIVLVHDGLSYEKDDRVQKYDPERRFLKGTGESELENFVKQTVNNYTVE